MSKTNLFFKKLHEQQWSHKNNEHRLYSWIDKMVFKSYLFCWQKWTLSLIRWQISFENNSFHLWSEWRLLPSLSLFVGVSTFLKRGAGSSCHCLGGTREWRVFTGRLLWMYCSCSLLLSFGCRCRRRPCRIIFVIHSLQTRSTIIV